MKKKDDIQKKHKIFAFTSNNIKYLPADQFPKQMTSCVRFVIDLFSQFFYLDVCRSPFVLKINPSAQSKDAFA